MLDVATGTGWAALAAAQHVGPTGRVLGVDLAPELLERARQKVAAAGLTHVEFRAGDAERLDLGDQHFDVVLCASALFFVPDMLAALREWHRVLKPGRPGGVFGIWADLTCSPYGTCGNARLRQYGVSAAHGVAGRSAWQSRRRVGGYCTRQALCRLRCRANNWATISGRWRSTGKRCGASLEPHGRLTAGPRPA